ncbi:Golgi-specific brefeldin A-resistance guanine nucleotide exchange factor 1-like isoform X2 [Tubulanus polymorphus]|uniref:Golgi-specific brefeldin A-resistance guanine nucleotide exchange factor 1-like isoform X2 n=1 Tax=Tubulanus polymorphus TaxID=672921 RepID=UPI003DA3666F
MAPPKNGVYIIQGEINLVVTAMRRTSRWSAHSHQDDEQDPLLNAFSQLKDILNNLSELDEIEPNVFLSPFLDVIRSEDTTGPITGLALTSVNKFLSYGLVEPTYDSSTAAIENIADAVTHARFVGTDPGSDEVVLMKILHVLRTLLLTPAGAKLTNESVCEIMQSCFRICFEMRLSELLRKSAEHTLMDMVQLLFSRLPQFKEDNKWVHNLTKKLKMRAGGMDAARREKKKRSPKPHHKRAHQKQLKDDSTGRPAADGSSTGEIVEDIEDSVSEPVIATTPVAPSATKNMVDIQESFQERYEEEHETESEASCPVSSDVTIVCTDEMTGGDEPDDRNIDTGQQPGQLVNDEQDTEQTADEKCDVISLSIADDSNSTLKPSNSETELNSEVSCPSEIGDDQESIHSDAASSIQDSDFVNPRGVRFTPQQFQKEGAPLIPYGLPCVRELFRFLISLINPIDRHNNDIMIHMGLHLLTVGLESGADYIGQFNSLLSLVKDELCRNLYSLLHSERLSLFNGALRVCFLLFESQRSHLKFQQEHYLTKLMDIIVSESPRISFEQREIALESVVQLWRIPGLVTELYLNYDCDIFCSNLFEDLTKLLSKNAFPVSGLYTTHLLSLDALLTVIDSIEQHCHSRILNATKLNDSESDKTSTVKFALENGEEQKEESYTDYDTTPPPPPVSGYAVGQKTATSLGKELDDCNDSSKTSKKGPTIRPNRMKVSLKIPTEEEIAAIKRKKKLLQTGSEQFNVKPAKGIAFLQDNGLLSTPLIPGEIVTFLKENPKLDKKMIGEYISSKKNKEVLEAFVKSFMFEDLRVDEALRLYLESFRLPGEAPVISYLMEHFAEHWHRSNGEPFANVDAAFTLAYAVIMLNVDQHNHNVKKQNIPMTVHQFKRNVKGVNGGVDFDGEMLDEIYAAIRTDEIVMPAEQTGLVKENYLWKVLLRRGTSKEGIFIHAPNGSFDHDLFTLIWGPTVAALSFVFDKSMDETIIQKAISGFRKCAMISAHYGLSDVFDNLVISLCKFTTLLSNAESPENIPVTFGNNQKAQLAAKTVFGLAHRHGDILREGWKNILDCLLQLYRAKLLPKILVEVEDFIDPTGRVSLIREEVPASRAESGVFSSFYSYFALSEPANQRGPSPEDQEAIKQAHNCIRECHLEQLIIDTKFLRIDSLQELVKALLFAAQGHIAHHDSLGGTTFDEDASVFYLELLIRVVLQNRDRVSPIWQSIRDHFYNVLVNASEPTFLIERTVVGLLRIAIRLLRREEIASQVLTSLRMLLMIKGGVVYSVCRQLSYGLHELLRTNAANIHSSDDWYTLFTLLEVAGAGASPPPLLQQEMSDSIVQETLSDAGAQSDSELQTHGDCESDRGYTSDSELYEPSNRHRTNTQLNVRPAPDGGSWLLVNKQDSEQSMTSSSTSSANQSQTSSTQNTKKSHQSNNQYNIALNEEIKHHDMKSLMKSCETLAFLVRDAAHVTPHNFESCVHCIRTFVEAGLNGGLSTASRTVSNKSKDKKHRKNMKRSRSSPSHLQQQQQQTSDDETDPETVTGGYHSLSIQLLDLMHTLHTRAAAIFSSWADESNNGSIDAGTSTLWAQCWCPLLQGIARLCCDTRRQVRSQALTYLQRALLVHDLQTLSAIEWESCFNKVMFPLLAKLLNNFNLQDPTGVEETRMRASTLLCKVFLQHLSPLLSLSTFTALWLTILEFMDKYMHADNSDLLYEAIPESLKNMLLVMDTAGIFELRDPDESKLWKLTWDRIDTFLPNLKEEVFKPHQKAIPVKTSTQDTSSSPIQQEPQPSTPLPSTPSCESTVVTIESEDEKNITALTHSTPSDAPKCVLHAPLPQKDETASNIPILLNNPDVINTSANVPIISPQGTPERAKEITRPHIPVIHDM